MINASLAETGPESCLKFSTLRFLEDVTHREGRQAIAACEEEALDPDTEEPTKIDVTQIDVDGDSADAVIALEGTVFDGQKIEYAFVERGAGWKFDDLIGFVDLDAARLILRAGRKGMLQAKSQQEAENIACWIGRMEQMSDTALEDLLLEDKAVSSECTAESNAI